MYPSNLVVLSQRVIEVDGYEGVESGPNYPIRPPAEWDALTPFYDVGCTVLGLGRRFKRQLVDLAPADAGCRVLDLGCGTGVLLDEMLRRQPALIVDGVEPDARARAIAAKRLARFGDRVRLHGARGERLPFADEMFDVVFSTLVLHHVPDRFKGTVLGELRRVLSPSGSLIFADFDTTRSLITRERSRRPLSQWLDQAGLSAQHVGRRRGVEVYLVNR